MVTAPRTTRQAVQNAPVSGARLNVSVPAGSFGGGALDGASRALMGAIKQREAEADQLMLGKAELGLLKLNTDIMYRGEGALSTLQGEALFGAAKPAADAFKEGAASIRASLVTDRQRQAFDLMAGHAFQGFDGALQKRLGVERFRVDDETTKAIVAEIGGGVSALVANNGVAVDESGVLVADEQVEDMLSASDLALESFARRNAERLGVPAAEFYEQARMAARSAVHEQALTQALAQGDDELAAAYLDKYGDDMAPQVRAKMTASVEGAGAVGDAQRTTDRIFADHFDEADGDRTVAQMERDALAEAREISDSGERDAVVTRLKTRFAEFRAFEAADQSERYDELDKRVLTEGFDAVAKSTDYQQMGATERQALATRAQNLAAGRITVTSAQRYADLWNMATSSDPATVQAFMATNMRQERAESLSESDAAFMESMQAQISKEREGAGSTFRTKTDVVRRYSDIATADLDPRNKRKEIAETEAAFVRAVMLREQSEQENLGRELTVPELDKIAQELMGDLVLERETTTFLPGPLGLLFGDGDRPPSFTGAYLGDTRTRVSEVNLGPSFKVTADSIDIDEIPRAEYSELVRSYEVLYGRTPTDDQIKEFHLARARNR